MGFLAQVLPVWDCWLQDETANRILQVLTSAVQTKRGSQELPMLKPWKKVCFTVKPLLCSFITSIIMTRFTKPHHV